MQELKLFGSDVSFFSCHVMVPSSPVLRGSLREKVEVEQYLEEYNAVE
jgi:hypothetical protein